MTLSTLLVMFGLSQSIGPGSTSATAARKDVPVSYALGPGDQLVIRAIDVEEIDNKPFRIDIRGNINLPMAGRIRAAGLTTDDLEAEITKRLRKFINDPEVSVAVIDMRSMPVSVLGSVQTPGVHQL